MAARDFAATVLLNLPFCRGRRTTQAGHTCGVALPRIQGVSDSEIVLARQGTAVDPREAALIGFAVRVLAEPSGISDDDVAGLRAHGWSDRVIADVVGLVSLNLLTGAFSLVAGIQPERPNGA